MGKLLMLYNTQALSSFRVWIIEAEYNVHLATEEGQHSTDKQHVL